jgi:uncharacterized protein
MDEPNLATRENEFSEADSEALLRRYAPDEAIFRRVYNHSLTVKRHTLEFCRLLTPAHRVDHHLIILGSLLHDIGRFWCPPGDTGIMHGIVGARYLRAEHLYKCARIAERHLGVGIRREDILAQKLPLPIKDFVPLTVEERTICYIGLKKAEPAGFFIPTGSVVLSVRLSRNASLLDPQTLGDIEAVVLGPHVGGA